MSKRHRSSHGVVTFKDMTHFVAKDNNIHADWSSLLKKCRNCRECNSKYWNAEYWLGSSPKQGLSYVMLDRRLAVLSGLRRTALARYALHFHDSDTLYGVKVSKWAIDYDMYNTWRELTDICSSGLPQFELTPERAKKTEIHKGRWAVEEFSLTLKRTDSSSGEHLVLDGQAAKTWLSDLRREDSKSLFPQSGLTSACSEFG